MKAFRILVVLAFAACSFSFGQMFEGTMLFNVTSPRGVQQMKYFTKGDNVRMDMEQAPGVTMSILINTASRNVTMLMHQKKMFMKMNLDSMPVPADLNNQDADFKKTGKTETILGYTCEQVIITQDTKEVEMWVTKGLGRFVQANLNPRAQSPIMKKLEKELTNQGYFPLRMIAKGAGGVEETRMEVTSIDKSPLSANLFDIPKDYQKMEMPVAPQH